MKGIRPASRADHDLRIEVHPGLGREQVVLTLRRSDRLRQEHTLETLLTWYEARQLGHALLDASHGGNPELIVSVRPAHPHAEDRRFAVMTSDKADGRAVMRLGIREMGGAERLFDVSLSEAEARRLGHAFLIAANPTRLVSGDD